MPPLPRLFLVFILSAGGVWAANPQTNPLDLKPNPEVVQYAAAHQIPLEGFELAGARETAQPDDRLIVLFTVQQGTASRQWLGEFRSVALSEREAKSKPGTGLGPLSFFQSSLKTDTGHEFSFAQVPVALEIRTHGPFTGEAPTASEDVMTNTRVLATRDYLALGLAPIGEIELRLRAAGKKNPGLSFMFRPKYSPEQMAASTARAQAAGFTEDDERAYAEGIYALVQFAYLAFRTERRHHHGGNRRFTDAFLRGLRQSRLEQTPAGGRPELESALGAGFPFAL